MVARQLGYWSGEDVSCQVSMGRLKIFEKKLSSLEEIQSFSKPML